MAAGDLIALADIETYLSLPAGNASEAILSTLISAVSAFVARYCGRTFQLGSYTEIRDGKGTRTLYVRNPPIVSIASLVVGVDAIPPGDATTPGYLFDDKRIALTGWIFKRGLMNVSVVYTGGYATIPADLAQLVIDTVALRYREIEHLDTSAKTIAAQTTSFVMADFKPFDKAILNSYRRRTGL